MPPARACAPTGPPSRELTEVFCRVPSTSFSQAPWYALPVHLCRFRVRSHGGLFPGTAQQPAQSSKGKLHLRSVTSSWPGNINPVPIDYASRPRLRGRLTLLRLALSRNPWTFGDRVSHPVCRYSYHHSHWRSLHRMAHAPASSTASSLHRAMRASRRTQERRETLSRHALLPRMFPCTLSFGSRLEPRYIFAAGQLV